MKLGIIGTGTIVTEFLPALSSIDNLEIKAILSTPRSIDKAKQLAETYNIGLYTSDFEELAAAGIDTVYVAVPNHMHYDYCEKALNKGLNVIVEKPMTSNAKQACWLQDMAKEKGCFLFEAITTVYLKSYEMIDSWLDRIGDIKLVESFYSQYSRRYDAFRAGEVLPAFDPAKSGGALMDLNLYNVYFVTGLFGKPDEVMYYANIERNIDTSGTLIMKYPSFHAVCIAAKDSKGLRESVVQGTDGIIRFDGSANVGGKVTLELYDGTQEEFEDREALDRVVREFTVFNNAINAKDYALRDRMVALSVSVSEILTAARKTAGIVFPADEE